jgi:phenylpropionate dioxygenase-like ring-hydroxylating dioxygenase large terminal subunit
MQKPNKILKKPYAGYYNAAVPNEDEELTHVGPGTPCGEYLRRFWHPVSRTDALKDLPLPIRILGEDLVLFRNRRGAIGLLQRHCSHRGASLEFGRIEERGIRCCYHGWLYDVDGTILEMPNELPGPYSGQLHHGAYPVREFQGLVFAFMGPPGQIAPFPMLDTLSVPGYELVSGEPVGVSNVKPCNWLQIMDNVVDPVHEGFLHTTMGGPKFIDANGREIIELGDVGELDFIATPIGIICQVTRRIGDDVWIRMIECICPNIAQIARAPVIPPQYRDNESRICFIPFVTRWRVPVDDTNTIEFAFVRVLEGERNDYANAPNALLLANYGGRPYEQMQREPGDYEAQVGQRSIARHALEHLGSTDRGVTMLRRRIRDGIQAIARGEVPVGICRNCEGKIPTYGQDLLIRVPRAATAAQDHELLRKTAREIVAASFDLQPMMTPSFRV